MNWLRIIHAAGCCRDGDEIIGAQKAMSCGLVEQLSWSQVYATILDVDRILGTECEVFSVWWVLHKGQVVCGGYCIRVR